MTSARDEGRPPMLHPDPPPPERGLPTVSVVIPTRDRRHRLVTVLSPLLADPATTELIVVADGDEGSAALLRSLSESHSVLRVVTTAAVGGAGARQAGIEAATGEVVLLLDDDVVAAPGLVSGHARAHAGGLSQVVVGSMPTTRPVRIAPDTVASLLYAEDYEDVCRRYAQGSEAVLRNLWGGNVSLRRVDARRVPWDDGRFGHLNHSDRDFGLRCLRAGLHGRYEPRLRAEHQHHRPLDAFLRDARRQGAGRALLHRDHPDLIGPLNARAFVEGMPRAARWATMLARRRIGMAVLRAGVHPILCVTLPAPLAPVQVAAVRLLRRIEQERGAREALR